MYYGVSELKTMQFTENSQISSMFDVVNSKWGTNNKHIISIFAT